MSERTPSAKAAAHRTGLLVACAAAFTLQAALFHSLRHDDAYITYRYAQNVLRGRGPVFNPGERVLGTTAPGHFLLATAFGALAGEEKIPQAMAVLGCAGWALQALAALLLLEGAIGFWPAAVIASALALGAAGSAEWVALETNLCAACVAFAMLFGMRRLWLAAAAACALGALLRPDALIAAVPLGILCIRDLRSRAIKPALSGVLLLAPWGIFATRYYGSPLPQTLAAKTGLSRPAAYLLHLFVHPAERIAQMGLGLDTLPIWAAILFWIFAALGTVRLVRGDQRAWILPAAALCHAAVYELLRPPRPHIWHLYPLVWPFLLLVGCGILFALEKVRSPRLALVSKACLASALPICCLVQLNFFSRSLPDQRWLGAREAIYLRVSEFLVAHSQPGDVFSSEEVGTIAWRTDLAANDEMRLVTRDPEGRWRRLLAGDRAALRWAIAESPQQYQYLLAQAPRASTTWFEGPQWRLAVLDLTGVVGAPR